MSKPVSRGFNWLNSVLAYDSRLYAYLVTRPAARRTAYNPVGLDLQRDAPSLAMPNRLVLALLFSMTVKVIDPVSRNGPCTSWYPYWKSKRVGEMAVCGFDILVPVLHGCAKYDVRRE